MGQVQGMGGFRGVLTRSLILHAGHQVTGDGLRGFVCGIDRGLSGRWSAMKTLGQSSHCLY